MYTYVYVHMYSMSTVYVIYVFNMYFNMLNFCGSKITYVQYVYMYTCTYVQYISICLHMYI